MVLQLEIYGTPSPDYTLYWILGALAVVMSVVYAVALFFERKKETRRIVKLLEEKRVTQIIVSKEWVDHDKGTSTYNVQYVNRRGQACHNRCKISAADDEIYWKDPL